jgi:hypothetical protein
MAFIRGVFGKELLSAGRAGLVGGLPHGAGRDLGRWMAGGGEPDVLEAGSEPGGGHADGKPSLDERVQSGRWTSLPSAIRSDATGSEKSAWHSPPTPPTKATDPSRTRRYRRTAVATPQARRKEGIQKARDSPYK